MDLPAPLLTFANAMFWPSIIFLAISAWQGYAFFKLASERGRLYARKNELYYNAEIARGRRDSMILQMLQIIRDYREHEKAIIYSVNNYSEAIGVLSSLPSRFPDIKSNNHYSMLLGEVASAHKEVQNKIESHNAAVRDYNILLNSSEYRFNQFIGRRDDDTYEGDEMLLAISDNVKEAVRNLASRR